MTAATQLAPDLSERAFQARVTELCFLYRLTWHHETDSRRTRAGYPDLTIVGPRGVVWAELKTDKGRVQPQQHTWLEKLRAAGQTAEVWRPRDWDHVTEVLAGLAGRGPVAP